MKTIREVQKIFLIATLLLLLGGCTTVAPYSYAPYVGGTLQGSSIKIEAEDGSFVIEEGRFSSPFQANNTGKLNSIEFVGNYRGSDLHPPLLESVELALAHGAKRVRVTHPASTQPLFGVLLLNQRFSKTIGASARSYLVRIPDSYVSNAQGGRVSVVYEPVSVSFSKLHHAVGWALWLSDTSF